MNCFSWGVKEFFEHDDDDFCVFSFSICGYIDEHMLMISLSMKMK